MTHTEKPRLRARGWTVAVLAAAVAAGCGMDPLQRERDLALLVGYEAATSLIVARAKGRTAQDKQLIDTYLRALGIEDITYPDAPVGPDGDEKAADEFMQKVTARLKETDENLAGAFTVGWYGVLYLYIPADQRPDFAIRRDADKAGFEPLDDRRGFVNDIKYLEWIVHKARLRKHVEPPAAG